MNMKRSLILLCGLLTGFTLQSTKVNAQTQTVANDQKLVYPYTFAPSEGLVNQTEKEHRQEICINGYWDFQPVRLPESNRIVLLILQLHYSSPKMRRSNSSLRHSAYVKVKNKVTNEKRLYPALSN